MKLWLLRPVENDPLWDPWYDKAFGFVVRAETEAEARALAHEDAGDENRGEFMHEKLGPKGRAWLDAEHSTCVELPADGEPGVVIRDFASA